MSIEPTRRKLLFHIGDRKTGTTTIQNAFATGKVSLDGGRILYPGRMAHNYLYRHFKLFVAEGRLLPGKPGFPGLARIAERLQQGNYDVAVISGEDFEDSKPRDVFKVLSAFMLPHVSDHAVICYIRPHAGRILSSYAEQLKIGLFSGTVDNFAKRISTNGRFHYARRVEEWVKVFGTHYCLRPMIRSELAGGSVLQDFIATGFGPDAPIKFGAVAPANESLCLEDLVLVRLIQDSLQSRNFNVRVEMGRALAATFGTLARAGTKGTRLRMHRALAEGIRLAYREDAETLDATYFRGRPLFRTELDRAVDEALPTAQSLDPADHFNAETLRALSVMAEQINAMLDHQNGPWFDFLFSRRIAALHGEPENP